MANNTEAGPPKGWQVWGSLQAANARLHVVILLVGVTGLAVAGAMTLYIQHLNARVDYLTTNRQMYCYADGTGMYKSSEQRPQGMVLRYARDFVQNIKSFDPGTVAINYSRAVQMMVPQKIPEVAVVLRAEAERLKRNEITQYFIRERERDLVETEEGYVYEVEGRIGGLAGTAPMAESRSVVRVVIGKFSPTEGRPEGLGVLSVKG